MIGWVDNAFKYYPAIDVLVHPSLWEGLSMTLIEAMAFGKPLVASNIKGNRECVFEGENGFLCTPKNPAVFKEAIEKLVNNRDLLESMSLMAKHSAEEKFDVKKNFDKISTLYDQYLTRR